MIILGIDPGTATTGYGVIETLVETSKKQFQLIEYGCIVTPKEQEMPLRLYSIQKDLRKLLKQHKPDCVSIEQLFFGVNSRTAMTVGQARGVVLSTVASYRIPIFEYQGLHVKHTITGSGKADKKEIQKYVMRYLGKRKLAKPANGYIDDAADALAVAICHYIKVTSSFATSYAKATKVEKATEDKKVTEEPKETKVIRRKVSKVSQVSNVSREIKDKKDTRRKVRPLSRKSRVKA